MHAYFFNFVDPYNFGHPENNEGGVQGEKFILYKIPSPDDVNQESTHVGNPCCSSCFTPLRKYASTAKFSRTVANLLAKTAQGDSNG